MKKGNFNKAFRLDYEYELQLINQFWYLWDLILFIVMSGGVKFEIISLNQIFFVAIVTAIIFRKYQEIILERDIKVITSKLIKFSLLHYLANCKNKTGCWLATPAWQQPCSDQAGPASTEHNTDGKPH